MIPSENTTWWLAALVPGLFVFSFILLAFFAAPQHDDFCFAYWFAEQGFIQTVVHFYTSIVGRVTAMGLILLPEVIASTGAVGFLTAYSFALTAISLTFCGLTWLAIRRGWPGLGVGHITFLAAAFLASCIAVAPDLQEMLYWLPGVACYLPPAAVAVLFLAETSRLEHLSIARIGALSIGGFFAAMCNEFSGPWLLLILGTSFAARLMFQRPREMIAHATLTASVLAGFLIIVAAPGNANRRAVLPNSGNLPLSLSNAWHYAGDRLDYFIHQPAIIICLVIAAIIPLLGDRKPLQDRKRETTVAVAIFLIYLACLYFEFFAHEYSTGIKTVERAQNQALIFVLFGACLSLSMLARTWLPQLRQQRAVPYVLSGALGIALVYSPSGAALINQAAQLRPFHAEAVERDRYLRDPDRTTVTRHRVKPSLLFGVDADVNGGCIARYYGKSTLTVEDVK